MMNFASADKQVIAADTKKTYAFIDIAKAIGIILVVFAHINTRGLTCETIYSFHMPLFFVLAGMTFVRDSYKSFGDFLIRKAKRLLIPYLIYSLLTYAWFALVEAETMDISSAWQHQKLSSFLQIFLVQGTDGFLTHNVALWFIPCLFVTETIFYIIGSLKEAPRTIVAFLFGIVGYIFTLDFMPEAFRLLPWQLGVAFSAIPFLLIGNLAVKRIGGLEMVEKRVLSRKAVAWAFVGVALISIVLLALLNRQFLPVASDVKHVTMGSKQLGNPGIFYLASTIGSAMIIVFAVLISGLIRERIDTDRSALMWLGKRTYAIMAIHYPVKRRMVSLVGLVYKKWWPGVVRSGAGYTNYVSYHILPSLIAFVLSFVLSIVIAIAAEAFMTNIKLPGRSKDDHAV